MIERAVELRSFADFIHNLCSVAGRPWTSQSSVPCRRWQGIHLDTGKIHPLSLYCLHSTPSCSPPLITTAGAWQNKRLPLPKLLPRCYCTVTILRTTSLPCPMSRTVCTAHTYSTQICHYLSKIRHKPPHHLPADYKPKQDTRHSESPPFLFSPQFKLSFFFFFSFFSTHTLQPHAACSLSLYLGRYLPT